MTDGVELGVVARRTRLSRPAIADPPAKRLNRIADDPKADVGDERREREKFNTSSVENRASAAICAKPSPEQRRISSTHNQ
jgi:hypothetical protein